jgi:hypothetical protein
MIDVAILQAGKFLYFLRLRTMNLYTNLGHIVDDKTAAYSNVFFE